LEFEKNLPILAMIMCIFTRIAPELGSKALIISDRVMEQIGHVQKCIHYLREAEMDYITYLDVNSEPTDTYVREALQLLKNERCDLIIALGGGSCIDAAKAVAVVAKNGGDINDYAGGQHPIMHQPYPLVALPTTAGTGSEVTSVTVITNTSMNVKMMMKHPAFIPTVAIVDPLLTITAPPHVTAATGIDALCHAVEAYISRKAQPLTDILALESIRLIGQNLHTAYENGEHIGAREKMARASMLAGMAFSNASVCLVHGMSRPIGALFHVPHGISNAMLLPGVLEFSKESCIDRLAVIGRIFKPEFGKESDSQAAQGAIDFIKALCRALQIPNLKTWGIDETQFNQFLDKMASDALASGSPGNNPRVPSHEEIVNLYRYCYHYTF
jgi:alcohol dehydrogenase class IV